MRSFRFIILLFTINAELLSQSLPIEKLNLSLNYNSVLAYSVIALPDPGFGIFRQTGDKIWFAKSYDYGNAWQESLITMDDLPSEEFQDLASIRLANDNLLLTYKTGSERVIIYSTDNGDSWSKEIILNINPLYASKIKNPFFFQSNNGSVGLLHSSYFQSDKLYSFFSNDGISWPAKRDTIIYEPDQSLDNPVLFNDPDGTMHLIYQRAADKYALFKRTSTDNGLTWSDAEIFYKSGIEIINPKMIMTDDGTLNLAFEKTSSDKTTDIVITRSFDLGKTWNEPESITKYVGNDFNHALIKSDGELLCVFNSDRSNKFSESTANHSGHTSRTFLPQQNKNLYMAICGKSEDTNTPPIILSSVSTLLSDNSGSYDRLITAKIIDDENFTSKLIVNSDNNSNTYEIEMYDDGNYPDQTAGDSNYTAVISGIPAFESITYKIQVTDQEGNVSHTDLLRDFNDSMFLVKNNVMNINKVYLPVGNDGILGDVDQSGVESRGKFEGNNFLFSGGFLLSGFAGNNLWANAQFSAARLNDYQPGKFGSLADDAFNRVYELNSSDPDFSKNWQIWKTAVENCGAEFYDGDSDGLYTPIDKNANGKWDIDEDRPILYGDKTLYTVINDAVPSTKRRYSVNPVGIEVSQTIWAYDADSFDKLQNVIFIKYKIYNTGSVEEVLNDCMFSAAIDGDLGNYTDDLNGCDTTLNSGYFYNHGADSEFGENCPAFFTSIVQGPHSYLRGKSFTDLNGNGIYDAGVDTPLDTAFYKQMSKAEDISFPGASNLNMTSFTTFYDSHPTLGEPNTYKELRNYMFSLDRDGNQIDPCTFFAGSVEGNINCSDINPKYLFSGDPVTNSGWICKEVIDQRNIISTGPFNLKKGEPVEIIVAYTIGRGETSLTSITEARKIVKDVNGFYSTNFASIPVSVEKDDVKVLPTSYTISQNYPNPFNPSTVIEYSMPTDATVKLQVFDILGREVSTLVNQHQKAGNYKHSFNADELASGIYFYNFIVVSNSKIVFNKTNKMVLIK